MLRRQLPLILAVAWCVVLFGAASVIRGGQQQPLDLNNTFGGSGQFDRIIEKQTWWLDCCTPDPSHTVVNAGTTSDPGTWDINDHWDARTNGYLAPGASTSTTWRHVFDWNPIYSCRPVPPGTIKCMDWSASSNRVGFYVTAPVGTLTVSLCYAPQGRCFVTVPVWDATAKWYVYIHCSQAVYSPSDPAIVDIPNSNGGKGIPTTLTLTVANPDTRPAPKGLVKSVSAMWGLSSDVFPAPGCDDTPDTMDHHDYPFAWSP